MYDSLWHVALAGGQEPTSLRLARCGTLASGDGLDSSAAQAAAEYLRTRNESQQPHDS